MGSRRTWAAWLLWAAATVTHSCGPTMTPAFADAPGRRTPPAVAIGPTGASADLRNSDVSLDDLMREELGSLDTVRIAPRHRASFLLQGTITRLERERRPDGVEVRCEVSVIVSDAAGGAVRMVLSGRAGARGGNDTRALERMAAQAAVRGALRPLGQGLSLIR